MKRALPFSRLVHLALGAGILLPVIARADITIYDRPRNDLNFATISNTFSDVANAVIPFLIGVAFVAVIWGIFKYVMSAGDAEKVAQGRMMIIYSILALFLMLSFWGFVTIISKTLFT